MKKNVFLIVTLLVTHYAYSQVGINITEPKATLDVAAQTTDGSKPEGIIAPRLTGDQLKLADSKYTSLQKGAIVYATMPVTTVIPGSKTEKITVPGYYYFDGSVWQKIINISYEGSATIQLDGSSFKREALTGDVTAPANSNTTTIANSSVNSAKIADASIVNVDLGSGVGGIYKGSGSLNGNTAVTQGSNTLTFNSNAVNAFSIDGNTLSIDTQNDRIGIGTSAPSTKLDISSSTNGAIKIADGSQQVGYVLTSDANGVGTWRPAGATASIVADFPSTETLVNSSSTSNVSTTLYLDLPKGKWLVSANLLIGNTSTSYKWNGFEMSSSNTGSITKVGWNYLNTSLGGHTFKNTLLPKGGSGNPIVGVSIGNGTYNMVSGSQLIEVTAASARIYFVLDKTNDLTFLTSAWENNIYAIPIY